jgi:penicillin-binding protein 1C
MIQIPVCSKSGHRIQKDVCPHIDTIWAPKQGLNSEVCQMHKLIFTNAEGTQEVNAQCYPRDQMKKKAYFTLNPTAAYYYKKYDPSYEPLPPISPACTQNLNAKQSLEFIYPRKNEKIYIPLELNSELGKTIFKVAHIHQDETVYWHLNDTYVGSTTQFHEMALQPPFGKNQITVIDQKGNQISRTFEILNE